MLLHISIDYIVVYQERMRHNANKRNCLSICPTSVTLAQCQQKAQMYIDKTQKSYHRDDYQVRILKGYALRVILRCLYVCNREDTYYKITTGSRQGSQAKHLCQFVRQASHLHRVSKKRKCTLIKCKVCQNHITNMIIR